MYSDISDFFRNMTSTSFTLSLTALATDLQTVGVPQTCFSGNNSRHHIASVKQFCILSGISSMSSRKSV